MNDRTRLGLNVLGAALLLGLLGDALLRATPWGLNVFLWTGALAASVVALARQRRVALDGDGRWLLPVVLVFAAAFAWRDSLTLRFMDALAIVVGMSLVALRAQGGRVRLAGVAEYALGIAVAGFNAAFGVFPLLFFDVKWNEIPRTGWTKHALSILRGLCIAVPLLLVFGGLFMAADAIFEGLVRNTFNLDSPTLVSHVFLIVFFAWVTGGLLRGMMLGGGAGLSGVRNSAFVVLGLGGTKAATGAAPNSATNTTTGNTTSSVPNNRTGAATGSAVNGATGGMSGNAMNGGLTTATNAPTIASANAATANAAQPVSGTTPLNKILSLGIVEIGIVVGLLDVLFLCFVAVQIQHYFHGAEWVMTTAGVTFSDYARRGFFELVCVATLVLPILLGAHWLLRKEKPVHERVFRVMAGVQIVLLFVIMASAVGRMLMYASMYGLTELRLYTTAFMGWLGVVFIWFALTVLRGRRERFACGALVAGFCVLALLHVLNPDAFIVRTNINHERAARNFDAHYAASLSADAVPALVEAMPSMSSQQRGVTARVIVYRWLLTEPYDWRSWNWSRARARRELLYNEEVLREFGKAMSEGSGTTVHTSE